MITSLAELRSILIRNPVMCCLGGLVLFAILTKTLPDPGVAPDDDGRAAADKVSPSGASAPTKSARSADLVVGANTRCATALAAFNGTDKRKVSQVDSYVREGMREQDCIHVDDGERSMLAKLSAEGYIQVRAMAIVYCGENSSSLLHDAAAEAYDGVRSLQNEYGIR